MNKLPIAFFFLSLAQVLSAAPTGHWLAQQTLSDGQTRETSLWLKADGDTLSGDMTAPNQDAAALSNGKINGNDISFSIVRDYYGEERKTDYSGTFENDGLTLHMPGFGGAASVTLRLSRFPPTRPVPCPRPSRRFLCHPPPTFPRMASPRLRPWAGTAGTNSRDRVTDKMVREMADAMVATGMRDAGYIYVNIDDTWEGNRDANGNILTNNKFPDMKALADYVHSKGLKLGIYSSPGPKTCAGYEGSYRARGAGRQDLRRVGHRLPEVRLVQRRAGVRQYQATMAGRLRQDGRRAARTPAGPSSTAFASTASWTSASGARKSAAICGARPATSATAGTPWRDIGFDQQRWPRASTPAPATGTIPTCSKIGNGGMTDTEYRTHMSLWSLLAAPLLAGNDLRNMSPRSTGIL